MKLGLLLALLSVGGTVADKAQQQQQVADLVANMTLAEKESLLRGIGWGADDFDPAAGYYVGNTPSIPRLNIPPITMQDAGQGFRTTDARMVGEVTSWSCGLGLASTWDPALVGEWAEAVADEYRAKGANTILGPGLNTHRVARGGRNAECKVTPVHVYRTPEINLS
jgi:beta-glucosidase